MMPDSTKEILIVACLNALIFGFAAITIFGVLLGVGIGLVASFIGGGIQYLLILLQKRFSFDKSENTQ